jgi:polysaccharide pyruvyl transferase WcaK-like protein
MISALCTETPVTVVGWGYQKYREVLAEFELESYCSDASQLSTERLVEAFARIVEEAESIKARMRAHLPEVQARSRRNHEEALRLAKLCRDE